MRRAALVAVVLLAALVAAAPAAAHYTKRGTVTRVIDGDTLEVAMRSGESERVRLIGIDTPELGVCYGAKAKARATRLAASRKVVVRGDASQSVRDKYGRLLGYVRIGTSTDLGRRLILGGFGKVYVYRSPFARVDGYRVAQRTARRLGRGLWSACARPASSGGGSSSPECHPSYSPCLPIVGDLDCADVRAMGKAPVRVSGSDPYRLDGDGDGWGCE